MSEKIKKKVAIRKKISRFLNDPNFKADDAKTVEEIIDVLGYLNHPRRDNSDVPRILVASIIPDDTVGVKAFLKSLMKIDYPKDRIDYCLFFSDNDSPTVRIIVNFSEEMLWRDRLFLLRQNGIDFSGLKNHRTSRDVYNEFAKLRVGIKNRLCDEVMYGQFDYLIYIEPECVVSPWIVDSLLKTNADFAYGYIENNIANMIMNAEEIQGLYNICMVKHNIIEKGISYKFNEVGEDTLFCQEVLENGFKIEFLKDKIAIGILQKPDIENTIRLISRMRKEVNELEERVKEIKLFPKDKIDSSSLMNDSIENISIVMGSFINLKAYFAKFEITAKHPVTELFCDEIDSISEILSSIEKDIKLFNCFRY